MRKLAFATALAAAVLIPWSAARAQVSVSVHTPEFGIRIGAPLPRAVIPVYYPAPVYHPAPVYYPPPVYAPRPVYLRPRVTAQPIVVRHVAVPAAVYPYPYRRAGAEVAHGHFHHKHGKRRHRGHH